MTDQEFLEMVVKELVDHPSDVTTTRVVDELGVLITLKINPEDMGKIIGKQGQTARALRTLLRTVGAKNQSRVNLKIDEPEGSTHPKARRDDYAPATTREPMMSAAPTPTVATANEEADIDL